MTYSSPHSRSNNTPYTSAHTPLVTDVKQKKVVGPSFAADIEDVRLVERIRPSSLRSFDQIPMYGPDLLDQAKQLAPMLSDSQVAFVGDSDGLSLLLGLGSIRGGPRPAALHLLDFDERLLNAALELATRSGFADLLHVWRYNVFDPVPFDLAGRCDFFVTNPPYGMRNKGQSARLFIARAFELITPTAGFGAIILPDDAKRPWTNQALRATMRFMARHGWERRVQVRSCHRYHLDDDPGLMSDLILVSRRVGDVSPTCYAGRKVDISEIMNFYGRSIKRPYPKYIRGDGTFDYGWESIV